MMTRSQSKASKHWTVQVVHIADPDITSPASLVLLARFYWSQDRTNYTEGKMYRIRRRWMKEQMQNPDAKGGLTCAICGKKGLQPFNVPHDQKGKLATLDHKVRIIDGGDWRDPSNFRVACFQCNTDQKHNLTSVGQPV